MSISILGGHLGLVWPASLSTFHAIERLETSCGLQVWPAPSGREHHALPLLRCCLGAMIFFISGRAALGRPWWVDARWPFRLYSLPSFAGGHGIQRSPLHVKWFASAVCTLPHLIFCADLGLRCWGMRGVATRMLEVMLGGARECWGVLWQSKVE